MADDSPATSFNVSPSLRDASPSATHNDSSILSELSNSSTAHDGEKHPKGKRKRTAAKDKMILEEAYKSNPKPDKQARLEIVDRVSLNEKEVQIWFQNRRQNDRRKSRPLSPEELAALRYGGVHGLSDGIAPRGFIAGLGQNSDPAAPPTAERAPVSPSAEQISPEQSFVDASTPRIGSQESNTKSQSQTTPPQSQEAPSSQRSQEGSDAPVPSFSSSVGYLANRWNLGSSFSTPSTLGRGGDDSIRLEPFQPSSCSSDTTHNATKSQSQFRLSLSLEGKAELAENESNGSAIAAISLLRSSSGILQPSAAKRNASLTRSQQPRQTKKAKFSRTTSTYARLESVVTSDIEKPRENSSGKVKVAMLVSPTDSDKENWSPDEDGGSRGNSRRRPLPGGPTAKSQNPRRMAALGEHKGPAFLNSRANTAPSRPHALSKGGTIEIFDDADRPAPRSRDDEVERFMRGEVSPSKKGDMDCVAGLLSLSQGAWR
ncbi:homeobox transcription factor [Purpureocillium lavendulum]|uniref:Homeobox transcription factor n=1 Tax=Purpureocillium lavendulum TaxID=1247861 RepID=A0AB34G4G8_9HYPO|nr:homeobox transcription factor [Purpureocillium lavendulum]